MARRNKLKESTGQVAVEFILMFIIVSFIVFYIWNMSISLAALQIREYASFMVGRAITASYADYKTKISSAQDVMANYNKSEGFAISAGVASKIDCYFTSDGKGLYGNKGGVDWNTVSDSGVACSMTLSNIIPLGGSMDVVSESLTWSEMSDKHCKCALQFGKKWKDCTREDAAGNGYTDNGC